MPADTSSASPEQSAASSSATASGHELVVVANRLPVDARTLPDGATEWVTRPRGLVTALE